MKIEVLQIKEDWRIIKLNKIHDSVFDPKHDQKNFLMRHLTKFEYNL